MKILRLFLGVCVVALVCASSAWAQTPSLSQETLDRQNPFTPTEWINSTFWGGGWRSGFSHGLFFGGQADFPFFRPSRLSLLVEGNDGQEHATRETFSGMEAYLGPKFRLKLTNGLGHLDTSIYGGVEQDSFFWRGGDRQEEDRNLMFRTQNRLSLWNVSELGSLAHRPEIGLDLKYNASEGHYRIAGDYTSKFKIRTLDDQDRHHLRWGLYTATEKKNGEYSSFEYLAGLEYRLRIFSGPRTNLTFFARGGIDHENVEFLGRKYNDPKFIFGLALSF